jgi:hypothetical protein
MSRWLDTLAKDTSSEPAIDRAVKAKPAAAVDACFTADGALSDLIRRAVDR